MLFDNSKLPKLAIVIPCYNEESVIYETAHRLGAILTDLIEKGEVDHTSFICFVDDGSEDRTWEFIETLNERDIVFKGLKLSRNFGHQSALLAGLITLKDRIDCIVSIDADLQDDVEAIYKFIQKYKEGYDIVYGVRKDRSVDTFMKKWTALLFYKLQKIMGVSIVNNHADYRLMSSRVVNNLCNFEEVNLYLRGIIPLVGFKSAEVHYDRGERLAGESKYPFKKMLSFALDGITSFSVTPLRFVTFTGFLIFALSLLIALYYTAGALFLKNTIPGWTSTVLPIYFIGGIQIFCIGLIGEYIGKIYKEVKSRPRFIIDKEIS
ncbi:MAG: glycosyltransferase family 2 protein [Smithellaceae bacterium]|nr:glycosyltransferase family 2 protein [Smithellaceae bacterium]